MKRAIARLEAAFAAAVAAMGGPREARRRLLVLGGAYAAALLLLVLLSGYGTVYYKVDLVEFEVGKVADRDVVLDRDLPYVDQDATQLKYEASEKLVPPVFVVNSDIARDAEARFGSFRDFFLERSSSGADAAATAAEARRQYPGLLGERALGLAAKYPSPEALFGAAGDALARYMDQGVAYVPADGLERYNPRAVEVRRLAGGRLSVNETSRDSLVTLGGLAARTEKELSEGGRYSEALVAAAVPLVAAFAKENCFFDEVESAKKLEEARLKVEPVTRVLVKGERVVKKGFIVTEADFEKLTALSARSAGVNGGLLAGTALYALLMLALGYALFRSTRRRMGPRQFYFLVAMPLIHLAIAALIARLVPLPAGMPAGLVIPTALFSMTAAILLGTRSAILLSLLLSLSALPATGMDLYSALFSFFSGTAGAYALKGAGRRIDLVRAGVVQAAVNAFLAAALALLRGPDAGPFLNGSFWAAFNGFFCGVLTLGWMPVWEQLLNSASRFRLMELSDLNAPVLGRLLLAAPGTYSHSVTVAHLAESACREIGADALLARVGAYYHDIGKIDQPDAFIENQASFNKHDFMEPRQSAAVIRNHLRSGVERARQLGLPEEVVEIIAQHHGNGLIAWFYDRALKAEGAVDPDDFSYPGEPPRSKEAAVVMLADSVEAAARSLKKPTPEKLERFVRDLVADKLESGQLARSELTFKDLVAIQAVFARILGGHYHSRIEYPKARPEAERSETARPRARG